jgi:hypothetical protein
MTDKNIQEAEVGSGTKVTDVKQAEKRAQLTLKSIQLRLKQEKERAEQEKQRAEQEKQRADEEKAAKERLIQKLKELGIDPSSI